MQDVTFTFVSGPTAGVKVEREVGRVVIGRQPGEGGLELLNATQSVSRVHAEIVEQDGQVLLRNISPNGTRVDGKMILETLLLKPGMTLQIGDDHVFDLSWEVFDQGKTRPRKQDRQDSKGGGPLSSPVVRIVLLVYILGLIGVVIWATDSGEEAQPGADWAQLAAEYADYRPAGISESEFDRRTERARKLILELSAVRKQNLYYEAEQICRELMSLDRDINSPLYQYGAACLGSN